MEEHKPGRTCCAQCGQEPEGELQGDMCLECSQEPGENTAPVRFLPAGTRQNRIAIAGFALGLFGFFGIFLIGLSELVRIRPLPGLLLAGLFWGAPVLIAVGFGLMTYLKPGREHAGWRRLCRFLRVMIILNVAILSFLMAATAAAHHVRPRDYTGLDDPTETLHQLQLSEPVALFFWPVLFLSLLVLATMFRYLSKRVAGKFETGQFFILQALCSILLLSSIVCSALWGIGLIADIGFNSPRLIFRVYPLLWGVEVFFTWMTMLLLMAWLTGAGMVLLLRLAGRLEVATFSQNNLPELSTGGIWPFCWTLQRIFLFFAVMSTAILLATAYDALRTRGLTSHTIWMARIFLDEPESADTDAIGRAMQRGFMPEELGNRVLDKAARANITGKRASYSDKTIRVFVQYPNEFRVPSVCGRGSRLPMFARGLKRTFPVRFEKSSSIFRDGQWHLVSKEWGRKGIGWIPRGYWQSGSFFSIFAGDGPGEVRAGVRTEVRVWSGDGGGKPTYQTVTDVFETFSLGEKQELEE